MLRKLVLAIAVVPAAMFCLAAGATESDDAARFEDHKLIRVDLKTQRELRTMLTMGATPWACRVNVGPQDFSVSPEQLELLEQAEIQYDVLVENVQRLFDEEQEQLEQARAQLGAGWFDVYRTWPEVNAYMDDLVALRPDLVEKLSIGTTHEGRTIHGMRITAPGGGDKPGVLFNGCQHAREWIAVMVPMYIADRLVRDADTPAIQTLLEHVEFFIVPIVNPDGYEFTYAPGGNRMWRKNRRHNGGSSYGVDTNRNWDIDWNGGHSNSTNPSSDVYVGPAPMSEPETQAMAQFVLDRPNLVAHIDFHSYSQLILHPWGFPSTPPPNIDVIEALGAQMSQAIDDVHGKTYPSGTPGELLYFASGVFPDWTFDQRDILGFTVEMRPTSSTPGFLLPPSEIIPTAEENFAAAMAMAHFVTQGVAFSYPNGLPGLVDAGGATSVAVNVQPISSGPIDHAAGLLHYRINGSNFASTSLTHLGGTLYEASFPPMPCGVTVEYYFEIQSQAGQSYFGPLGAPEHVFSATAADIAINQLLVESFDSGIPAGWTATGLWHATSSCPRTGACDTQWAYYGQSGSCNYNTGSANSGQLTSPPITIPELNGGSAELQFCYTLLTEDNSAYDKAEFSINDGPWQRMSEASSWTTFTEDVSAYSDQNIILRWRFDTVDSVSNSHHGWQITGVSVTVTYADCPPCQSDLTGDGAVDVSDLLELLAAWGPCPGSCQADITSDGNVDVSDLLLLLGEWGTCN